MSAAGGPPAAAGQVGRHSYRVEARTAASPEVVWPLLADARRWKDWTFLTRSERERDGDPSPDGVGSIRRLGSMGFGSREEVLAFEPPTHLAYTILSGFPVRNYRADVTLAPDGDGTRIEWSGTFDERIPGTGALTAALLKKMIGRFATGLARFAARDLASRP